MARSGTRAELFKPVSAKELARRHEAVARLLELSKVWENAPISSQSIIDEVRKQQEWRALRIAYDDISYRDPE